MTNRTSFKDDGHFTTETGDETYENIKAFLLKVYKADTVSLYEFSDNLRNNYFLKTPAGFFELLFKVDYKNNLSIPDNRFIWQLRNFFANELNENKKLESKLNNLKYSQSDLVSFFNNVYSSGISVSKDHRPPGELVFMGGVSYNSFKITPYNPFWGFSTVRYNHSIYPLVGIGLIQYGSRNLSKYFVLVELKFTGFKNSGLDKSNNEWVFKSQIVAPGIGMGRKWINKENFSLCTSVNTSFLLLLNNKVLKYHSLVVAGGRNLIINLGARTGISVNHFEIWGQYNPRIITHSSSSFSPKLNFIYTGISWKIPQKK